MSDETTGSIPLARSAPQAGTTLAILTSLSICHLLNDMNQSLVPAIYPILNIEAKPNIEGRH